MGKSTNKKNKATVKPSTDETDTSGSPKAGPVAIPTSITKTDKASKMDTTTEAKVTGKQTAKKKSENTNRQETFHHGAHLESDEDSIVDHAFATAQKMWKLWAVMGLVAGALAVLGQVEVADQGEQLVIEKGVALLVNRPTVFKYIAELANYKMWYPGVARFEPTDASPMGIGKHFTEVLQIPLYGELFYDNVVVGYESPRYVSFLSDSWMQTRVEMEVERRDSPKIPTSLKYRVYTRTNTVLAKYVALPCMRLMYGNSVRQAMFNIRFVFAK